MPMNNELITEKNEWVSRFMESLDRMLKGIEHLAASCRPALSGERYLTDKEVSARLKVSRRTLQDYRNEEESHISFWAGRFFIGRAILKRCWRRGTGKRSDGEIRDAV